VQKAEYDHDKHATPSKLRVGDWVMIHFPQEETRRLHKLSRSWHGPYQVISRDDPEITTVKIFFQMSHPSKFTSQGSTSAHHLCLMTSIGVEVNAQNHGDHLYLEIYHKRIVENLQPR